MYKKTFTSYKPLLIIFTLVTISNIVSAHQAIALTLNVTAINEVINGTRTVANASWWGFDESDATKALQAAIRSKAKKIIVPNMGKPWIVTPLFVESGKEIVFEKGVIIAAKSGSFLGRNDSLFTIANKENVTINGYGAEFVMRKQDYVRAPYKKAEWRNGITILGSNNIKIYGVKLTSSGGDGIYIGRGTGNNGLPNCDQIHIKDVVCDNNYRQGVSVVSVSNLLIENSTFKGTDGTPPQAGIDFEPNRPDEILRNCKIKKCVVSDNTGYGILIYLPSLNKNSNPISIDVEGCTVQKNRGGAVFIAGRDVKDRVGDPSGEIIIRNCKLDGPVLKRKPQRINIIID